MRIHYKTITDIATRAVLYDDVVNYEGPIALCGAPKIKMAQPPPPTVEETEQRQLTNAATKASMLASGYETYRDSSGTLQLRPRALTPEEEEERMQDKIIRSRLTEELKRRPGEVSPEQEEALGTLYGSEEQKMNEALSRFAVEQSGARGLSLGDTPLAREVLRAKALGQSELGVARAGSKLNFAERERLFTQGLADWRRDLQQQQMANLMAQGAGAGQVAVGLMGARGNLKPTPYQRGGGGVGSIIGGIGSGIMGVGSMFSSRTLKHNITTLRPKVRTQLVDQLLNTPVYSWAYNGDTTVHVGPVTEELPRQLVTLDGKAISIPDMIGALILTVQALAKDKANAPTV